MAPRRLRLSASAESMPRPQAPASTAAPATPVNADATPSALNAVAAARTCVPFGRSRSALLRDLTKAVSVAVVAALPHSAATPHAPTDSCDAWRPLVWVARFWMNWNPSNGATVGTAGGSATRRDVAEATLWSECDSALTPDARDAMRACFCEDAGATES